MEFELICRTCWSNWASKFSQIVNSYKFSGEYSKFLKLSKFYISSKKRDDEIYKVEWLFDYLEEFYPVVVSDSNIGKLTCHILDGCFPMFWDSFQNNYIKSIFIWANLGWFVGDLDTDELIEKAKLYNSK